MGPETHMVNKNKIKETQGKSQKRRQVDKQAIVTNKG